MVVEHLIMVTGLYGCKGQNEHNVKLTNSNLQ